MIKAMSRHADGRPIVLLGLSKNNLDRMAADKPVRVEFAEFGLPPATVFIFTGETEEQMVADLQGSVSIGEFIDNKTPYDNLQQEVAHRLRDKLGYIDIERHDQQRWVELVAEVMTMVKEAEG